MSTSPNTKYESQFINSDVKEMRVSPSRVKIACMLNQLCLTLRDLVTATCQAALSIRFPRQKYLSGLPFPPPGDLPDPEIELTSPALADEYFTIEPPIIKIKIY